MDPIQHALTILAEECGELAIELVALSPATGLDRLPGSPSGLIQAGADPTAIQGEWQDVLGSITYLAQCGIVIHPDIPSVVAQCDNQTIGYRDEISLAECHELARALLGLQKEVFKALRFGIDEQRDLPTSNRERIEIAWAHVLDQMHTLAGSGVAIRPAESVLRRKCEKITRYADYARSLGTLTSGASSEPILDR